MRIHTRVTIDAARIPIQVDVGFGDAITPGPVEIHYPALLDVPAPHPRAYPIETVVAEKFHALVTRGITNSRLKDFYDLWLIAETFELERTPLATAIRQTFARRKAALSEDKPTAFTESAQMRLFIESKSRTSWSQASLVASQSTDILISDPPPALGSTARFTTAGYAMYESGANDHTVLFASSVTITQPRTVEVMTSVRFFSEARASATVLYPMSVFSTSGNGPRGNSWAVTEPTTNSERQRGCRQAVR